MSRAERKTETRKRKLETRTRWDCGLRNDDLPRTATRMENNALVAETSYRFVRRGVYRLVPNLATAVRISAESGNQRGSAIIIIVVPAKASTFSRKEGTITI